jgi:CPA1 family monovalent cation:H+ antiporter
MHETELVLLGVLGAVAALLVLAYRTSVPYPILLVVGGGALGFFPGVPDVELAPELVLVIALPPLLYAAAFFSSLADLRANVRPISLLAVGLVLATMGAVAVVAHVVLDFPWAAAFVLGAVLSPTDPVAATAIASRLRAPRRVVTIIEGESLVNDATGLIAYKFAVAAVLTGSFSAGDAVLEFAVDAVAGVAIGLAIGFVVAEIRRRIEDAPTEITISLVTPYFSYLPAEAMGASAVLAAVTTGIYLGWNSPHLISPSTRIQAFAFWEILVFVLNSMLFVLVGLQLPSVVDGISGESATTIAGYAVLVCGVVIVVRILFVFPLTYLRVTLDRALRARDPVPPWRDVTLVAWTGIRGAVSLAAALAIPLTTDQGAPFPHRDLIIFLTYSGILATLLLQGLSLPAVIRALGVQGADDDACGEDRARLLAAQAALARLDELADEPWVRPETLRRMRGIYEYRTRRFEARMTDDDDGDIEEGSIAYQRLRRKILEAERAEIIRLRNQGRINDDIMRRVERDLDLEDVRLEI